MNETLKIGLIQPIIDPDTAWGIEGSYSLNKLSEIDDEIFEQVRLGFQSFSKSGENPNIILIPELTVQKHNEQRLRRLVSSAKAVVVSGVDFYRTKSDYTRIGNRAMVIIPKGWPRVIPGKVPECFYFGKTFFTYMERQMFESLGVDEYSDPNMFILDGGDYGRIGVAICSDFFDIERFSIYKGRIHHLFIIAVNIDVPSYFFLAEAIGRLVYCNVVICNTGAIGGSVVFTPRRNAKDRILYRHEGSGLFTTQVVSVPVQSLDEYQKKDFSKTVKGEKLLYKASPPGYAYMPAELPNVGRGFEVRDLSQEIPEIS